MEIFYVEVNRMYKCVYACAFVIVFIPMKLITCLKLTCYTRQCHVQNPLFHCQLSDWSENLFHL